MSEDLCRKCGAKCCQYFCFEIDEPDDVDEFEDVRWYICHEGTTVHIDEGTWYISIMNRCNMLDDNDQCTSYDNRPLICRKYDLDNCDQTMGDYGYDEEFKTPDELEAYARQKLGVKFDRTRDGKRKRLAAKGLKAAKKSAAKKSAKGAASKD